LKTVLIIQTAFIGDAILATALVEQIKDINPAIKIDILVRKGNESLLINNPNLNKIWVWEKDKNKIRNLLRLIFEIRKIKFDYILNLHRFASSGFITAFSGAKEKRGFTKNPLSFFYNKKFDHQIGNGKHETERNFQLIKDWGNTRVSRPKLYPSLMDFEKVKPLKEKKYIVLAPASVWFTKALPIEKWIELCAKYSNGYIVYLLGASNDFQLCEKIKSALPSLNIQNLCGTLNLLQSAALMKDAEMNYVNDSAPLHLCSSMNAPVKAIFCSTIPEFGFGPLSQNQEIIQVKEKLDCRPCGLHGYKSCPKGHFKCGLDIEF